MNEPNDGDDEFYVDTPLDVLNDPPGTRHSKYSEAAEDADVPDGLLTWREGLDGVTVEPGMPALPKQVVNVTANGLVLRGVGFRAGYYRDTGNLVPLTGAPAIEGATANTTFDSPTFFPEKLATANYFGALGASGRTSLILSPTQYRNDPGIDTGANPEQLVTNTERAYSKLGFRLFYSGDEAQTFGGAAGNTPALASAPTITDAQGTLGTGRKVTFSVRASGDPSAGVQEVWVTWTGGPDGTGAGRWRSLNLTQDALDSTLWTGTLDLNEFPAVDRENMRFLVQAANGVGAVGLDTADGDGYPVGVASNVDASEVHLTAVAPDPANGSPLGVSAKVTGPGNVPIAGRTVTFSVIQGGQTLFGYGTVTNSQGLAVLAPPTGTTLPVGAFTVVAEIFDAQGNLADSDTIDIDRAHLSLAAVDRTPDRALRRGRHGRRPRQHRARGPDRPVDGVPLRRGALRLARQRDAPGRPAPSWRRHRPTGAFRPAPSPCRPSSWASTVSPSTPRPSTWFSTGWSSRRPRRSSRPSPTMRSRHCRSA